MVDLFENEQLRKEIRVDFNQRKGNRVYKSYVPAGSALVPADVIK